MSADAATRTTTPAGADGELSHRQILTILTGLMLAMFLAALDQTIVATAIRTIGDDLHGLSVQAWVTTSFLITSTITTPLYGKLSDIYGRKKLFLFAIVVFLVGSALCGMASSMYMLAGFRAFQGLGAGGVMSLTLAIVGDIIPPRQRAKYQGYFMATFASASVLGPVVGGFLAGQHSLLGVSGWRWIFYINIPIGIIALVVITRVLHLDHHRHEHRIDWWGATMLIVGLVPLLIVAEQGREWGWGSAGAWLCYLVGVAGIALFVWAESRMGDDALLPLRLFRNRTFAVGSAQSTIVGLGMFGAMAALPLYLQIVQGASPTKSGLLLLPLVLGMMSASLVSGQLTMRTGHYKKFPIIGSVLMVAALFLLTTVGADTSLVYTDLYMLMFGAGLGLNMQTLVLSMQNAVPPKDMGVATAAGTFFRQLGGTLGTAVFLSILFTAASSRIPSAYTKAESTPAYQAAAKAHPQDIATLHQNLSASGGLNDTNFINQINHVIAHPFLVGFSNSMDLVFLIGAFFLLTAIVMSLFLKEVPLRSQSAMQARREAEAEAATDPDFEDASGATHDPELDAPPPPSFAH